MKPSNHIQRVFIVEDDPIYQHLVKYAFERDIGNEIHLFKNGKDCINNLYLKPDVVSLDYTLPDMDGSEVLKRIKSFDQSIKVVILSGQNDISTAIELLKAGAYDYIVKDTDTKSRLVNTINKLKETIHLRKELDVLKEEITEKYAFQNVIIGNSEPMIELFQLIQRSTRTNITVSITGETGTGKEIIAKSIHYNSKQKNGPFVAVNVSAIPKELLESELFGYEKGAFTGANTRKLGQFERANKGTLFLDEIAEMDISLQAKLLRAIQEREITRIGGDAKPIKFDTRIIVATHRDLMAEVRAGNFREDLYYRLLGLPILLPPLRERGNDILLLMRYFLDQFCTANDLQQKVVNQAGKKKLLNYHYPGNVRELKAVIELAAVMADGKTIMAENIQFNSPKKSMSLLADEMTLKEFNRKIVYHYLKKYNRDVITVAKKLDIGKSTIYRMLKEDNGLSNGVN